MSDSDRATAPAIRPRRHRRLVVAVAALLILGGVGWVVISFADRGPEPASVDVALSRFRSSSPSTMPAVTLRPEAGVYEYVGSGVERLSFLGTTQAQGPTLPATVTHVSSDCWKFEIEYNSFHRQSWRWCLLDGVLVERASQTIQQFDFGVLKVDEESTFSCDPDNVVLDPTAIEDDEWPQRCVGHSSTTNSDVIVAGTLVYVGIDTVTVGNENLTAFRYRSNLTLTGDQTGSERVDMWFSTDNGLPVRNERTIRVVSPAPPPLNNVVYTEEGDWKLSRLTPER